jgi:hypothetical protein
MGGYISIDYTTISVGDTVDVSAALVEQSAVLGAYFDGSTAAVPGTSYGWRGSANSSISYAYSSDLTYIWEGTANSSVSQQRGNSVTDYMRSGSDNGTPQIITNGDSKILRYIYRTETNPIAVNITSLSSNSSMAGKTYTLTAKIRPNFAINGARLRLGGLDGTGFNLVANQWQTVSLTGVYPASGYTSAIWAPAAGAGNYGKYIDISEVSLVEGVYKGSFFDGNTPASSDFSYSWTGTANNSASYKKGPRPLNVVASKSSGVTGAYFYAVSALDNGDRYTRFISPAGTDNSSWRVAMSPGIDYASIVAGSTYTIYVKYRQTGWVNPTITFGLKDPQSTNPVMSDSNVANVPSGSTWQTFSKTFTAMINGLSTTNLYIVLPVTPPTDVDGIFDIAEWYLVEGEYSGPVFDGSTPAAGDFTYSWVGTADNSASLLKGTSVASATAVQTNQNYAIQSSDWAVNYGGKSIRVIPTVSNSNNTWVAPGGDSGAMRLGMVAGKTYTALAKLRISTTQTGTLNSAARSLRVLREGFSSFAATTASPNLPGVYEHRLTFTVPSDATQAFIRLYNGASVNNGDVWWDDFLLVEGNYTGPYFDGSRASVENLCTNPSFTTNVAGWGGIGASVVRVTNQGGDGAVAEVTQTISGGGRQGGIFLFGANQPAGNYSISFDMKGTDASFTDVRVLFYDPVAVANRVSVTTPLIKDGNYNRYTFNVAATGVFDRIYVEALGSNIPLGTKSWIDRVLIERGSTASEYFEGTGDFSYSWTGTANASTSNQSAPGLNAWGLASTAQIFQSLSVPTKTGGSKCMGVATRGVLGDGMYSMDIAVSPNTGYTFSCWVKTSAVHRLDGVLRWKDSLGNTLRDDTSEVSSTITVGQWSRVSINATSHASSTKVQPMWRIYAAHTPTTMYFDGATLNEGLDTRYFDGSTAASGDFTYSWGGTAHNSNSIESAPKVVGMTGNYANRAAYQTSLWSASGSKSIAIVGGQRPNNDSFAQWETNPFGSTIVGGKTYTFMGRLRTFESFPSGADGRAWGISPTYNRSGGGTGVIVCKPTTTGAGFHEVRQTVTFPSDATTVSFIRLYNGSPNNSVVYWDNVMIVEGTYTGDFINPDQNPLALWSGTPHQSSSYGYSPQFLDIAGKPIIDGTDVATSTGYTIPAGPVTIYTVQSVGQTTNNPGYWEFSTDGLGWTGVRGYARLIGSLPTMGRLDLIKTDNSGVNTSVTLDPMQLAVTATALDDGANRVEFQANGGTTYSQGSNALYRPLGGGILKVGNRDGGIPGGNTIVSKRVLVYAGKHDLATRQAISRYLGNKYGVKVA